MPDLIHVLILEDRQDDAEIMVIELEADGFEVVWRRVETPNDFIASLTAESDVILADYTLPQFSAPEALALLKQSGHDIPFIVVTGSISEETAVSCMKQGAVDYLIKDRLSRLGEAVRQAINQRDLRRAQRKAEQELVILGRAIETSINAVVITDLGGVITFINRAVIELWTMPDHFSVLGQGLNILLKLPAQSFYLLEELKQGRSAKGEIRSQTADGREIVLQYASSQISDHTGQTLSLMFTFIDVTEQKTAETLRIDLERERELRDVKSHFISMLVHDFRNPLASLQVGLTLIDKYYDRYTMPQILEKVRLSLEQSRRMNQLIDDVLMIGKLEATTTGFNPEPIELVAFCESLFDEFKQSVDTARHLLDFIPNAQPIIYPIDRDLMRRAVNNLLSNAVKYSPSGGNILLAISETLTSVLIQVADTGMGIPAADQRRIFDGFQRGSNVGTLPGTGLGLAIVKQIAGLHGGSVGFTSKVNQGTTFAIKLPYPG